MALSEFARLASAASKSPARPLLPDPEFGPGGFPYAVHLTLGRGATRIVSHTKRVCGAVMSENRQVFCPSSTLAMRRDDQKRPPALTAMKVGILSAACCLAALSCRKHRNEPFATRPDSCRSDRLNTDDWSEFVVQLCPKIPHIDTPTPSQLLHVARIWGMQSKVSTNTSHAPVTIVNALTSNRIARSVFGDAILVVTAEGPRFRSRGNGLFSSASRAQEHHPEQILAAFGEAGLPLSTPLEVDHIGRPYTILDAITATQARYDPTSSEVEWTSLALLAYLHGPCKWRNRFGQEFSFDDMCRNLLRRAEALREGAAHASCAGTHILNCLVVLLNKHRAEVVLEAETADSLTFMLCSLLSDARSAQEEDGSWSAIWSTAHGGTGAARTDVDSPAALRGAKLVITGHMAEYLSYLPENMRPKNALAKAKRWLWRYLHEETRKPASTRAAPGDCPTTHAICATYGAHSH